MFFSAVLASMDPTAEQVSVYPSIDQLVMIDGALLQAPIVQNALALVKSKVSADLLNLAPSVYQTATPSAPKYQGDPVANCYWPSTQCTSSKAPNVTADITTCPGVSEWGLSFDDGPTFREQNGQNVNDTTALMSLLQKNNVTATFFIVGSNAIQYPDIVKQAYDEGHQIALHTWTHHPLTSLTNEQIVAEIKYNEAIVYKAIGKIPRFFRPPYGDIDDRVRAIVQALGYQIVIWNKDSTDADQPDTSDASRSKVVSIIEQWLSGSTSFISLEHDISIFTTSIALQMLQEFFSQPRTLKPLSVARCLGQDSYLADPTPTTTIASAGSVSTQTYASTPGQPSQSGDQRLLAQFLVLLPLLL
ncbi:hypothetical protein EDD86DRAFT_204542 [Gorgonomyces haynaldii]|nr:hypothetical protein EDD86DRAFT_204542 [Gorgonomyces haynaldii]